MNRKYIIDFIFKRFEPVKYVFRKSKIIFDDLIVEVPEIKKSKKKIVSILGYQVPIRRYRSDKDYVKLNSSRIILNIDIIGEIYDYLTLNIENENRSIVTQPFVDLLIYYFYSLIKDKTGIHFRKFKNINDFVVCVTHDVDRIGDAKQFHLFKNFIKGIRTKNIRLLKNVFSNKNNIFQVENILKIEKKYGVEESTWFLLSHTKKFLGFILPTYGDYNLDDVFCKKMLNLLKNKEIGLHIPFVKLTTKEIKNEKQMLTKIYPIKGARAHYLRGNYPNLLIELDKAGFLYDSTFGSNNKISFRFGTSFPFHPIINGNKTLDIFEVPLNIMDGHVSSFKVFKHYIKRLYSILKITRGVLVINWHQSRFNVIEYGDLYEKCFRFLLSEGKDKRGWLTSIKNLINEVEK